jgi:hypothetical protein
MRDEKVSLFTTFIFVVSKTEHEIIPEVRVQEKGMNNILVLIKPRRTCIIFHSRKEKKNQIP